MNLYGTFTADKIKDRPMLCSIDLEFPKVSEAFLPADLENSGIVLSCDWDESDWDFDQERGEGAFRAKGVHLNQRYANGHIADFMNAKVDTLHICCDENISFKLTGLMLDDGGTQFIFPQDRLIPWIYEYED